MAIKWLLDASAVLAWLQEERGSEVVDEVMDESAIASINAAEVIHKLVGQGATPEHAIEIVDRMAIPIIEFSSEHLRGMAKLSGVKGLSLGDRACLAIAQKLDVPAVTSDQVWATLSPKVRLIREAASHG